MKVIVHCGAYSTEEDRLLKSLLRNREILSPLGTAVPGPGRYRPLIKDSFTALEQGQIAPHSSPMLKSAILDDDQAQRVVLSNARFWGSPRMAMRDNVLYPHAEERMAMLQQLFPEDALEIHMSVRNPVGFIPALMVNADPERQTELIRDSNPMTVSWSNLIERLRAFCPTIPITVWCYEDLPLIWAEVIRSMVGLPALSRINGGMDLLATIMSKEGMQRLRGYLHQHQDLNEDQKRRVLLAFLDKYALDDAVEEELDMPGWTEELIDRATQAYEADTELLADIPGVTYIAA